MSGKLLPAVLKAIKRTPDAALAPLPALLSGLAPAVPLGASTAAALIESLLPLILGPSAPRASAAVPTGAPHSFPHCMLMACS